MKTYKQINKQFDTQLLHSLWVWYGCQNTLFAWSHLIYEIKGPLQTRLYYCLEHPLWNTLGDFDEDFT